MLFYKRRILAAKIETTSGTPIALGNADAAMNVFNLVANPTAEFIQRQQQGAFGQVAGVIGLETGQFTFSTEIHDAAAGAAPAWLQTLFAGCGLTYSAGVFSLRSEAPGTNVKTLTLGCYVDGVYKQISGAAGTFVINAPTGQRAMIDWTFMGRWATPTDVALLTPTYPTKRPIMAKSGVVSIASFNPCFSNFTLDIGNVVTARPCLGGVGGLASYVVTDRNITGTMDPESKIVATNPVYTQWATSVEQALSVRLQNADTTVTIAAPKFQITNAQEGDREGLQIDTITYQCNVDAAPNDELTITFDEV
jgi:hypothetical protein